MPRKKKDPLAVETKQFRVLDPESVKKTVEIPVVEHSVDDVEKVEKIGEVVRKKKIIRKRSSKFGKKVESKSPCKFKEIKLKKDGYKLIITEKPQAAGKIAAALADGSDDRVTKNKVSYYELDRNGERVVVGCAVGHLFSVSQTVGGSVYPIFDIGWFPNFEVNKKDFTKSYYSVLKSLVKGAGEIILATDFDVEGEVIGYNIIRYIAGQKDAKRMKFSSLTAAELQDAYDNRMPTIEWGQAIAGETRHYLDWLYGINLSRALMSAVKTAGKFRVMSIGRVQGPTLNLIVEREIQIKNFKSSPYWQVFLTVSDGVNKLDVKHNKDIVNKNELDKFKMLEGREGEASTKKNKQTINPPAPFDLTSLQTEAYKFHGITPSNALASAQKLYLSGLISYPRTSSQKINDINGALDVLKKLKKRYGDLVDHAVNKKPVEGKKSDPAHPAIIPTGNNAKLEGQEAKIYDLIAKRFISCFCENAELENKKVEVVIEVDKIGSYPKGMINETSGSDNIVKEKLKFNAKGMEILKAGWMDVYPVRMEEKDIRDMNGRVKVEKVKIEEKETKPPRRYSPASLVTELEKRNLGTKATRANILETLYNRKYIMDKSIKATELGIRLIESLKKNSPVIIDEELTREIEKDMDIIRNSKRDLRKKELKILGKAENALTKIAKDFKKKEMEIGKDLIEANESLIEQEKEDNKLGLQCPSCKKGELTVKFTPRFRSYFVACTAYPNCRQTFSLPKGLIKNDVHKECEDCNWPLLLRIMQGKRPWQFCFNPECPSKRPMDIDGKDKKEERYVGQVTSVDRKKVKEIESVEKV
jgi:DNA topoisomerase I